MEDKKCIIRWQRVAEGIMYKTMNIKFQKNLEHQDRAVKSIVEILDTGKNLFSGNHEFTLSGRQTVFNKLELDDKRILENMWTELFG